MKTRYKQLAFAFIILIVLSAIAIFFVIRGRNASVDADAASEDKCTLTEHVHDESCLGDMEPLCGTETGHEHTDECYVEKQVLICGHEEDIKTLQAGSEEEVQEPEDAGMSARILDDMAAQDDGTMEASIGDPIDGTDTMLSEDEPEQEQDTDGSTIEGTDDTSDTDPNEGTDTGSDAASNEETDEGSDTGTDDDGNTGVNIHTHTDACYETYKELACAYAEDGAHVHTEECYGEPAYACGLEEHVHGEACGMEPSIMTADETYVSDFYLPMPFTYYAYSYTVDYMITAPEGVQCPDKVSFGGAGGNVHFQFKDYGTYEAVITAKAADTNTNYMADEREMHIVFTVKESGVTHKISMKLDGIDTGVQNMFVHFGVMPSLSSSTNYSKADAIIANMTLEEKVGQLFIVHYPEDGAGTAESANAMVDAYHVGGFVAFSPMFENSDPDAVKGKIQATQEHAKIQLFFAVDEEGGRVVRASKYPAFRDTPFPAQKDLWDTEDVYDDAVEKGRFLKNLGFNMNLAPVADTATKGSYIYERTYGGDATYNSQHVYQAIRGHMVTDVAAVTKHFPGYGDTTDDTHSGQAVNTDSLMKLKYYDMVPFYSAMTAGAKGIMVSHNVYEAFGDGLPASISPAAIGYLRDTIKYNGIIMTDDLSMGAIGQSVPDGQASKQAIMAGADMVMTGQPEKDYPVVLAAVQNGEIPMEDIDAHVRRVIAWKIERGLIVERSEDDEAMYENYGNIRYGSFEDIWSFANDKNEGTITLLKDVTVKKYFNVDWRSNITLDLNGHRLYLSGDAHIRLDSNAQSSLNIRDRTDGAANKPVTSERQITEAEKGSASYDEDTRILTYYTYRDDGSITEHKADYSGCGAILAERGYCILMTKGTLTMDGVFVRNLNGPAVWAEKTTARPTVTISGCTFAGCKGGGEDIGNWAPIFGIVKDQYNDYTCLEITVRDSIFAANDMAHGGIYQTNTKVTVDNTIFSGNSSNMAGIVNVPGGQMYLNEGTLITDNVSAGPGTVNILDGELFMEKARITHNQASDGAGIYNESGKFNILGSVISHNRASKNGGGISLKDSKLADILDCEILNNRADGSGGGIYMGGTSTLSLSGVTITGNRASRAGGICHEGGTLSMQGKNYVRKNLVNGERNNVYLAGTNFITLTGSLSSGSNMGIMTEIGEGEWSDQTVIKADSPVYAMNSASMVSSDRARYHTEVSGSNIVLKEGDTDESTGSFEGLLLQYYANTYKLSRTGDAARRLEIIDTSGGILPTNDKVPQTRYMYLNEDGTPLQVEELMPIYYQKNVIDEADYDLQANNKFATYGDDYILTEIWVTDDAGKMASDSRDDWTIYPYSESLEFTTGEAQGENQIHVESGYIVRYVGKTAEQTKEIGAIFYDYDISDGLVYAGAKDAYYRRFGNPTTWQKTDKGTWRTAYANNNQNGINAKSNYATTKGKSVFAFGNANTASGWDDQLFMGYTLNAYNRRPSTFNGVTFELVKGLDEDGNIIWHNDVVAPKLFNDGAAEGKTTLRDQTLGFVKNGETYTLSYVAGTKARNLENFGHPGNYTNIWTNNFWPLDDMGTFGGDGHDMISGDTSLKDMRKMVTLYGSSLTLPTSDDGQDHNPYFGMQFSVKFTVNSDYIGPMEYLFFGDDDMWVFLDGKLISDIGGIHRSCGSFVNLWDYIKPGSSGEHEMSFYYLERGASGSTCWMQFNLPNVKSRTEDLEFKGDLKVCKTVEGIETDEEFEFVFTFTDQDGNELEQEFAYGGSKKGTVKSGGSIMIAGDEQIVVRELPAGTIYTVTEAPHGQFESGCINPTGTVGDDPITVDFVNTYVGHVMPSTGGNGIWIYILSGFLLTGAGILLLYRRYKKA